MKIFSLTCLLGCDEVVERSQPGWSRKSHSHLDEITRKPRNVQSFNNFIFLVPPNFSPDKIICQNAGSRETSVWSSNRGSNRKLVVAATSRACGGPSVGWCVQSDGRVVFIIKPRMYDTLTNQQIPHTRLNTIPEHLFRVVNEYNSVHWREEHICKLALLQNLQTAQAFRLPKGPKPNRLEWCAFESRGSFMHSLNSQKNLNT
jgi:hypothetical protein